MPCDGKNHIAIAKPIKKEIKSALNHAFEGGGPGVSREDWMASYDKFLAEFQKADANNDGVLDRKEWTEEFGNDDAYDQYDLNGDGVIDADEYAMMKHTEKSLRTLDADG